MQKSWTRTYEAAYVIALLTVVAYLPAMRCGYVWDDDSHVLNNATLRSLDGLRQIWLEIGATPQYYPLVHTTYWIEYRFGRLDPAGYHIVNILLHGAGAMLLWRVLALLRVPGAWAAAALFALHPVHVESVAWITERKNVLSGVFYFGAAAAYLRYALEPARNSRQNRSAMFYGAALLLFLCALLSKTVTCTLPAVLLLVLWWKRPRISRADVLALIPFFVLGIAFGLLTAWLEKHHVGAAGEEWNLSFLERCLVAGRVLCFYVGKLFWPARLTFVYPRWEIDAEAWRSYVYPGVAIGVVVGLWFARRRIGKGPLVAVLFFVGTLFPALGFFDVYPMRFSFVADHFQYLASAGVIALVAALAHRIAGRRGKGTRGAAITVLALTLATLGTLTWRQSLIYRDAETLWRDTIHKNPDAWMAHNNLGLLLALQGKPHEAIEHYRRALQSKQDFTDAYNNLANALLDQGRSGEAIRCFRQALQFSPDSPFVHNNLGTALSEQGRAEEAIRHFRHAVRVNPKFAEAHHNLGVTLRKKGKLDEAIHHYHQALQAKPDHARARMSLGNALKAAGQIAEALHSFEQAARLMPDSPGPLRNQAWILATSPDVNLRQPDQAIRLAERAAELAGHENAPLLDTLAAAYAAAGQFDRAVTAAQKAAALASAAGKNQFADAIRHRLALYQQAKPYHEPLPGQEPVRP